MTTHLKAICTLVAAALLLASVTAIGASGAQREGRSKPKPKKLQPGLYSGGSVDDASQYVALRVGRTRKRATETVTLGFDCGRFETRLVDTLSVRRTILRGGRSQFDAPVLEDVPAAVPQIGGLRRKGSVTGKLAVARDGTAHGSVRSRFTLTDPVTGKRVARCDSGLVRWQGRRSVGTLGRVERGRPAPAAGSAYYGRTTQGRPFVIGVAERGRSVERIGMTFDVRCPSALGRPLELEATRIPIVRKKKRRGSFARTGSFERSFVDPRLGPVTERYRWRLAGRFGPQTVAGGWKVSATSSSASGVTRCGTGRNRWRAVR